MQADKVMYTSAMSSLSKCIYKIIIVIQDYYNAKKISQHFAIFKGDYRYNTIGAGEQSYRLLLSDFRHCGTLSGSKFFHPAFKNLASLDYFSCHIEKYGTLTCVCHFLQ